MKWPLFLNRNIDGDPSWTLLHALTEAVFALYGEPTPPGDTSLEDVAARLRELADGIRAGS